MSYWLYIQMLTSVSIRRVFTLFLVKYRNFVMPFIRSAIFQAHTSNFTSNEKPFTQCHFAPVVHKALYKGMTMAVEWSSSIPQHKVWFTKTPNFECIKTFVTTIEHLNIASICVSVSVHRIKHMSTTDMVYKLKYIIDTW